jgi:hypothetical protein
LPASPDPPYRSVRHQRDLRTGIAKPFQLQSGVACGLPSLFGILRHASPNRMIQRSGGIIGFTELIGAGSFSKIADATLSCVFPSIAFFPVSISYNTAPSEKVSLLPSTSFPSTCSGDMY